VGGRKLIAVVYADMVGYSHLIGLDDEGTLQRLRNLRKDLIDPAIDEHGGRIVQTGGDSLLIVFDSIDGAMRCAVKVQQRVPVLDGDQPPDRAIRFRVGIDIGDAIADGTDLHGDAVNVAARLQAECPPGGICVSRSVRDHVHGRLDLVFGALGALDLKNIAHPVEAFVLRTAATAGTFHSIERSLVHDTGEGLPLPDKPSIAVLPFANMSSDPEQEYFTDGMVEEIITALSRIRWLFVIARNSSFTYKGRAIDIKQVGRELGVRYILEGSVRKEGQKVRITGQLIDAANGAHLWAGRFDGSLENVFELQDKVALSVAGVIEPTVQAAEIRRSSDRPTTDVTAYDLYLRAIAPFRSGEREKERYLRALGLVGQAIERDPRYGPALAVAAFCHSVLHVAGWTSDPNTERREGMDLAGRALRVAGNDAEVLGNVARVLGYFSEDLTAAISLIDRALELNPSFAVGWQWSGWLRLWAGEADVAIGHFETSMRLNPLQGRMDYYLGIGVGHFFAGRFEGAAASLLLSLQEGPAWVPTHRFLASCYAHLGRFDEAREIVTRLRTLTTEVVPSATHWRNPEHRELYLSGLRIATGEAEMSQNAITPRYGEYSGPASQPHS
jgi:adenylate cyclase